MLKSAIMENSQHSINSFRLFYIDESNQVKISYEIMRCQGYLFKVVVGTKVSLVMFNVFCPLSLTDITLDEIPTKIK